MKELDFIIQHGLTVNNSSKLKITKEYLKFENKNLVNNSFTTFNKNEIVEYRYGIKWITFRITFGREYQIYIRNKKNETLKLKFKTYFGRKKKSYHQKYIEILDALWDFYFNEIVEDYISKHNNGEEFKIGEVIFKKESITIEVDGLLSKSIIEIPLENVRTKNYYRYFAIYSSNNPSKINRGYNYLDDWNTGILYSVLRTILRDRKIETYE